MAKFPRILFLGQNDWANICNRIARAMNTHAGEIVVRVATVAPHNLGYEEDPLGWDAATTTALIEWARTADWLIAAGDGGYEYFFNILAFLHLPGENQRMATMHPGSAYRAQHALFNQVDPQFFQRRFVAHDLYRFAAGQPNVVPFFGPANLADICDDLGEPYERPTIAHSPSHRSTKGTAAILPVLEEFRGRANIDLIEGVSYAECVERRERAQVFVDQIKPDIGGFGASAVEAMASGCAVLADYHNIVPEVWKFIPRPPVVQVGNVNELRLELDRLVANRPALEELRRESLAWAHANTAVAPLAQYWLKHLE